jgi:hypothetical protein
LTPAIFDCLQRTQTGRHGEIWLADGMQRLVERDDLFALELRGRRYDVGDKLDFLRATVDAALARPDLGPPFREYLAARVGTERWIGLGDQGADGTRTQVWRNGAGGSGAGHRAPRGRHGQ